MEYMARVWDGSEGEVANGYWTCKVVGAEVGEIALTPLYGRLFSQEGPDFRSENAEICRAISMVSKHTEKRGIWVLDRGGDSREIMDHLLEASEYDGLDISCIVFCHGLPGIKDEVKSRGAACFKGGQTIVWDS